MVSSAATVPAADDSAALPLSAVDSGAVVSLLTVADEAAAVVSAAAESAAVVSCDVVSVCDLSESESVLPDAAADSVEGSAADWDVCDDSPVLPVLSPLTLPCVGLSFDVSSAAVLPSPAAGEDGLSEACSLDTDSSFTDVLSDTLTTELS